MTPLETLRIPPEAPTTILDKAERLYAMQRRCKARMVREGWVMLEKLGRWPRTRRAS